ncbi:MAG: ATP-binding protein [Bacteroidota bacterium]
MTNWIQQVIDIGTSSLERRADRMKVRTLNATCILGVVVPTINLIIALASGFATTELILIELATSSFFILAFFLNFRRQYYLASTLVTFVVYLACIFSFWETKGQIDHQWFLLVLAIYPFIVLYPKEWMHFAFSMFFLISFVVCYYIEFPETELIDPSKVHRANEVIYWVLAIMTFHQSIWLYYIHQSNVEDVLSAKEKAEENDRLKSAFLSNMSHEIRTPMNSIIGFSDYLSKDDLDEEQKKQYATIINDSCHQLLRVVNDILDISKIETNQMTINENSTNLIELANALYNNFEILTAKKGLDFQLQHNLKEDEAFVNVDELKLRQVLNNLLSNAIKYTETGYIIFEIQKSESDLLFVVKDTGIGIKEVQQEVIFDRFQQVENGIAVGTGLGLAISKGLAELMNGEIWVESKWQQGSTFYFRIPYQLTRESITEKVEALFPGMPLKTDAQPKQVLIAEDEVFNFKLLEVVLQQLGAVITWVRNGKDAIEAIKENPNFDLIFMDIKMPVMDGLEATRIIKERFPHIPIIAQSAFAFTDERERCIAAGCSHYLTKPIPKQELVTVFQKYASVEIDSTSLT